MFAEKKASQTVDKQAGHEELFDKFWGEPKGKVILESLRAGQFQEILERTPGFEDAFKSRLDTLDCSDGRVCSGHKMGLAGSGILLSPEDKALLKQEIKKRGLKVTGHQHCGAAALAHPGPDSDKFGYQKAGELAVEVGTGYGEVYEEDFRVPIHDERLLVVEETGRFDCANWPEFPSQFLSSSPALGLSDDYLKKEIVALINISFGSHGFGDRFSEENPFYVVVSASDANKLAHLKSVASEAVEIFSGRVRVDGFMAPPPESK